MDLTYFLNQLNERFDKLEELVGNQRAEHAAIRVRLDSVERKVSEAAEHVSTFKGARAALMLTSVIVSLAAGAVAIASHFKPTKEVRNAYRD